MKKIVLGFVVVLLILLIVANVWSPRKTIEPKVETLYSTSDPQFLRTLGSLPGSPILGGDTIEMYQNGDEIFPAMLKAIEGAQKTINFETFIYWSGDIGRRFAAALIKKVKSGVRVNVLLDWIGSRDLDEAAIEEMKAAGVKVEMFRPLKWYNIARLNHRTHRKLLVVDGKIGFTGGVGIADQWQGQADSPDHWRESHHRVEGPIVAQLQTTFLDNWHSNQNDVLHGEEFFPPLISVGKVHEQVFESSPLEGSGEVYLMYLLSLAAAKKSIRVAVAYFVPDDVTMGMLKKAIERGVKVEVIVPGPIVDAKTTRYASRAKWGDLLKAGVAIYEYQPTMFHCKYMIIDDVMVSVGSTNFDDRSFKLNHEANLNIYDAQFAKLQSEIFEKDKAKSKRVELADWETDLFR